MSVGLSLQEIGLLDWGNRHCCGQSRMSQAGLRNAGVDPLTGTGVSLCFKALTSSTSAKTLT